MIARKEGAGKRRVALFRETCQFTPGGPYEAPHFDVPTLRVDTSDGYRPGLDEIEAFVKGMPNKPNADGG